MLPFTFHVQPLIQSSTCWRRSVFGKTGHYDITEIFVKVALNTITLNLINTYWILVEGGQYLVEVEIPEFISTTWYVVIKFINNCRGRDRDRMGVGFTTTCPISAYHHWRCEFEPRSWRGVLDTTLCDQVCQWLATGRWFSPSTPVPFPPPMNLAATI